MLTRKCAYCGEKITLSLPYSEQYIQYQSKWYHIDCFKTLLSSKSRIDISYWINKTRNIIVDSVSKDKIDTLFKTHYNVSVVPKYIYIKLDSIYKGTYRGLAQPIPPEELLDILLRKMEYLDKNAAQKKIEGIKRINYDLVIAMSSYKSYKAWLTKIQSEQELKEEDVKRTAVFSEMFKPKGYVQQEAPQEQLIDYEETIE